MLMPWAACMSPWVQELTSLRCGCRPVISAARDGQQTVCAYACVNRTPLAANLSMLGVYRSVEP